MSKSPSRSIVIADRKLMEYLRSAEGIQCNVLADVSGKLATMSRDPDQTNPGNVSPTAKGNSWRACHWWDCCKASRFVCLYSKEIVGMAMYLTWVVGRLEQTQTPC